jgi:hypothetical protein
MHRLSRALCLIFASGIPIITHAQGASAPKAAPAPDLIGKRVAYTEEGNQADFPALCADATGTLWTAFVSWDGKLDHLKLAKFDGEQQTVTAELAGPGIIHQPALAADGKGALWVVWSQVDERNIMNLHARRIRDGKADGDTVALATSNGPNAFAQAASDKSGRVWITWQSMRGGLSDIYCRVFDPEKDAWSPEIQVTNDPGGDWEPHVAFDDKDGAWVLFDSSRGNEFNLYAAHVESDGTVGDTKTLVKSDRYEGRLSATGTPDGKGIWFAFERGHERWGLANRGHTASTGLNGDKDAVLAYWDLATGQVEESPGMMALTLPLDGPGGAKPKAAAKGKKGKGANANPNAKAKGKGKAKAEAAVAKDKPISDDADKPARDSEAAKAIPAPKENKALLTSVDLPQVMLDANGRPWVAVRYFRAFAWRIALARYDRSTKTWTQASALTYSAYAQDRLTRSVLTKDGSLWAEWVSDARKDKNQRTNSIQLARLKTETKLAVSDAVTAPHVPPVEYMNKVTPERPIAEHHTWSHDGTTYKLYFGDYHRHTDMSNCITANDGCIVEQFRYAYDMAKLDTVGLSDHTDVGKTYHPYEWWLNQKFVDVFYTPGSFTSMYAYEREQRWPYGHRNVIFAKRGGPIVYIARQKYLNSPWQALYPVAENGPNEILPEELWPILKQCGIPVSDISHTGATSMGTDWNIFKRVDNAVENLVEIFQGARVSYEGLGCPQPTVGLLKGQAYNPAANIGLARPPAPIRTFTEKNNGVYQNALRLGHRLGVWADSDHISTHTGFGGVYVKDFTREGIIEGLNARRTIAATDKIFLEFSCSGHLLGTEFELKENPSLDIAVEGTSNVTRVTIVRNEEDYQSFEPKSKTWKQTFTDQKPLDGDNRYYVRVEQDDGNMAWSSPVWVKMVK